MKRIIPFALLITLTNCKKEETRPADWANGTYQMTADISYRSNGTVTRQSGSGRLSVARITGDQFEFTEDYNGFYRKYTVRIQGLNITITDNSTESLRIGSGDYTGLLSGKGIISSDGKSLNFNTSTVVNQPGISFTKSTFVDGRR